MNDIYCFIRSLNRRVGNLEKDFEYIENEISKNKDLRNGESVNV